MSLAKFARTRILHSTSHLHPFRVSFFIVEFRSLADLLYLVALLICNHGLEELTYYRADGTPELRGVRRARGTVARVSRRSRVEE